MNKKMQPKIIAMFAKIAIIMLILGAFAPAVTFAQTPGERLQNATQQYQIYKDRVDSARDSYQESRETFMTAKDRFADTRTRENSDELRQATKDYLNNVIDFTIRRLEALKLKAEEAEENGFAPFEFSDNIEDYIDQLEDLKDDVEAAETREDFQAIIQKLREISQHVNLESRYFVLGTVNNRIDNILERSDTIAERIQEEIDRLDEAGKDTTKLKELLDEYNEALDDAQASHAKANELFDDHNGFDNKGVLEDAEDAKVFLEEAAGYIKETHAALKEANSVLREIFEELKKHRPGSVALRGTGTLTASGNGKATLSGDLEIEITAKTGVLTIADYGEDAQIEVTGEGTKEVMSDGTTKYTGFDGTATISGSSITVVISGDDIELTAEGTGSAVLRGNGTYEAVVAGRTIDGEWTPDGGVNV